MRRVTSAWTERHTRAALLLAVVLVASAAGLTEAPPVPVWVAIAVGLAAVGGLALDPFGGVVLGLLAAAALVGLRQLTGWWGDDVFWPALLETAAVVLVGAFAGSVGVALRAAPTSSDQTAGLVEPVFGSLGLLDHETALLRLEEEVDRALEHDRPVTLVLLETELLDESLDAGARAGAFRAVARLLESRIRDADIPFSISQDRLGAILPESSAAQAWDRMGAVLDAVTEGRFASRAQGVERSLADVVALRVGMAQLGPATDHADALLDTAAAALNRAGSDHAGGAAS